MWRGFAVALLINAFTPVVISVGQRNCYDGLCLNTGDGTEKSWYDAKTYCEMHNGTLLNVVSADMENKLKQFINDSDLYSRDMWIGINAVDTDSQFHWINGQPISSDVTVANQGDLSMGRRFATITKSSDLLSYSANTYDQKFPFICENPYNQGCVGTDSKYSKGRCYRKYESNSTWFEASNYCLSQGGTLATFNNTSTTEVINFLTSQLAVTPGTSYWIGLINRWWITTCGDDALYTDWDPDRMLSTTTTVSPCVVFDSWPPTYGWQSHVDHQCAYRRGFICQESTCPSTTTTITTTTSTTTTSTTTASTTTASTTTTTITPTTSRMNIPTSPSSSSVSATSTTTISISINNTISSPPGPSSGMVIGVVVGVVGGLLVICVIVVVLVVLHKKQKLPCASKSSDSKNKYNNDNKLNNNNHTTVIYEPDKTTSTTTTTIASNGAVNGKQKSKSLSGPQSTAPPAAAVEAPPEVIYAEVVRDSDAGQSQRQPSQKSTRGDDEHVVYADLEHVQNSSR